MPNNWSVRSLQDVCNKPISYGIVQTGEHVPDGIPCVRVVDMTSKEISPSHMIKTSPQINYGYKKTILKSNDILFALRGEIGLARLVDGELVGCNITRGIARISPNSAIVVPNYLLWAIRSNGFRGDMLRRVNGSALQEIPLSELRQARLLLPPIGEQNKIARILSTWDQAIATTEKLIENSKQQKKALIQQLLTGEIKIFRPSSDWKQHRLGDLFDERNERGLESLPLLSITTTEGVISRDDVGRKDTSSDDKSNYKRICPGDIGYNTMRMWQGVCGLSTRSGIVSPAYTIVRPREGVDALFMYYLFKTPRMVHNFYRHSQGLTSDTWNLKFNHFAEIRCFIPDYSEQKYISGLLHKFEANAQQLEQILRVLVNQKGALMQQLLTGKRRVKVDA